jgi:hypothetical protein
MRAHRARPRELLPPGPASADPDASESPSSSNPSEYSLPSSPSLPPAARADRRRVVAVVVVVAVSASVSPSERPAVNVPDVSDWSSSGSSCAPPPLPEKPGRPCR